MTAQLCSEHGGNRTNLLSSENICMQSEAIERGGVDGGVAACHSINLLSDNANEPIKNPLLGTVRGSEMLQNAGSALIYN